MSEPSLVNKPIQVANSILHAVEYGFAVKAFKIAARMHVPFLNGAFFGKIFDIVVDFFADKLYASLSKFIAFKIVDIQVATQKSVYEKSRDEFKQAVASGDVNEIAKKKAEFEAAFARGIHFDGV